MQIEQLVDRLSMIAYKRSGTYSYGDSAGFTPDFPFNPK
jgi:hypothetical protein